MAEEDMMLLAIKTDAKGAITDTQILDDKFKNLSTTFRKGTQETQKLNTVMAKQVKTTKDNQMATVNLNTAYLKTLAGFEALTSAGNQYISAQYKKIDADLAAGEISAEEAEKERKLIKQKEYYTGRLEELIAIARLATVAHMVYTAVVGMTTTATTASTAAVTANSVAWYANPMFWAIAGIVGGLTLLVLSLAALMVKFNTLDTIMEGVNKQIDNFKNGVMWITDNAAAAGEAVGDFVSAIPGADATQRLLEGEALR
tara:strand:+ start:1121 stop:1894 length:774 start_codon:yes stop_codon:yes gene_type:complete